MRIVNTNLNYKNEWFCSASVMAIFHSYIFLSIWNTDTITPKFQFVKISLKAWEENLGGNVPQIRKIARSACNDTPQSIVPHRCRLNSLFSESLSSESEWPINGQQFTSTKQCWFSLIPLFLAIASELIEKCEPLHVSSFACI